MWETPDYCQDNINRYSVAELGELLKNCGYNMPDYDITETSNKKWCWLDDAELDGCEAKTEANARALMLIYLIENKLLESNSEEQTKVHQQEESL